MSLSTTNWASVIFNSRSIADFDYVSQGMGPIIKINYEDNCHKLIAELNALAGSKDVKDKKAFLEAKEIISENFHELCFGGWEMDLDMAKDLSDRLDKSFPKGSRTDYGMVDTLITLLNTHCAGFTAGQSL